MKSVSSGGGSTALFELKCFTFNIYHVKIVLKTAPLLTAYFLEKNNLVTRHCGRSVSCPSRECGAVTGRVCTLQVPSDPGVMERPGVREAGRGDHQIFINL